MIANQVGSVGHYEIVKAAIEQECNVPVLGYMKKEQDIDIPSRHLGLIPAIERGELNPFFDKVAHLISETIDIDRLYELAETTEIVNESSALFAQREDQGVTIAVAKDAAFNFYYQENLELLEAYGAKLTYFSPLQGDEVPADADGLYLGGGFPEEFADELAHNEASKASIRAAITSGIPTLAECGGFMYLTESITNTDGVEYKMTGLIPGKVKMQKKLAALGYREIFGTPGNFLIDQDQQAKGHEFHYSTFEGAEGLPYAYETKGRFGKKSEGYLRGNLVAGYTHFHFASNPQLVERWIESCVNNKQKASK